MTFGIYQGVARTLCEEFDSHQLENGLTNDDGMHLYPSPFWAKKWRMKSVQVNLGDLIILNDDGSPFLDFKYLLNE